MELMELFVEVLDLIATPTVLVALGVSALLILCRGLLRPIDRVVITQWPDSESAMVVPWCRDSFAVRTADCTVALLWTVWLGGALLTWVVGRLYGELAQEVILAGIGGAVDFIAPYYLAVFLAFIAGSLASQALGHVSRSKGLPVQVRLDSDFRARHDVDVDLAIEVELEGKVAQAEISRMDPVPRWWPAH